MLVVQAIRGGEIEGRGTGGEGDEGAAIVSSGRREGVMGVPVAVGAEK